MKKKILFVTIILITLLIIILMLYKLNIIPHKQYSNKDFNIETYISSVDKDGDGIDDQTDILRKCKKLHSDESKI